MAPVVLNIYDVGTDPTIEKLNEFLTAVGTGAFHAGVEVYGIEYSYGFKRHGSGVFFNEPKQCKVHHYRESISMPETDVTEKEFMDIVMKMKREWPGVEYDLLRHNCVCFSKALCIALGVGDIPSWLNNLAGAGASLQEGALHAASAAQQVAILAAAKAGEIDAQYNICGTTQAKVQDLLDRAQNLDDQYAIKETAKDTLEHAIAIVEEADQKLTKIYFKAVEMDETYHIQEQAKKKAKEMADAVWQLDQQYHITDTTGELVTKAAVKGGELMIAATVKGGELAVKAKDAAIAFDETYHVADKFHSGVDHAKVKVVELEAKACGDACKCM